MSTQYYVDSMSARYSRLYSSSTRAQVYSREDIATY